MLPGKGWLTVCDSAADQDAGRRPKFKEDAPEALTASSNRVLDWNPSTGQGQQRDRE